MLLWDGSERGNGSEHRELSSVSVEGTNRILEQAVTRHSAVIQGKVGYSVGISDYSKQSPPRNAHLGFTKNANAKRGVDCKCHVCITCSDSSKKPRDRDFNGAINIFRLQTTELEGSETRAYFMLEMSGTKNGKNRRTH